MGQARSNYQIACPEQTFDGFFDDYGYTTYLYDYGLCDSSDLEVFCKGKADYQVANYPYRLDIDLKVANMYTGLTEYQVFIVTRYDTICIPRSCPPMEDWSAEDHAQMHEYLVLGAPTPGYEYITYAESFEGPKTD